MPRITRAGLMLCTLAFLITHLNAASVRIVGSSALFPLIVTVSERFGYQFQKQTPVVEATGTGGGIKFFCSGTGHRYPDLVSASRPMTQGEKAYCARHGVMDVREVPLGLDALVLVRAKDSAPMKLKVTDLRKAVAHAPTLLNKWIDIHKDLPDEPIVFFMPPETAGTREAFDHLVLAKGQRERQDGALRSIADQESIIASKITRTNDAVGVLSFAYFMKSKDRLQAIPLDGVMPSFETIEEETYPLVRRVYLYVKGQAYTTKEEVRLFVNFVTSECIRVLLTRYGLMPLERAHASLGDLKKGPKGPRMCQE